MIIKLQIIENGIARDVYADTSKAPVGFKFGSDQEMQKFAMALAQFPNFNATMIIAPKTTPPKILQEFVDHKNWPIQFYSADQMPAGSIIDPTTKKFIS